MNEIKLKITLEFLCLVLILSYFFIHKIYMVLIGIILSTILINYSKIKSFMRIISIKPALESSNGNSISTEKVIESNLYQVDLRNEYSKPTLVETIEELGFIPSIKKVEDINDSN